MTSAAQLQYVTQQVNIFFGLFILILGVIGNTLNAFVFASLKTAFAQNSCSLCFLAMAVTDLLCLLIGLLSKILLSGFGIDLTVSSIVFCKFRNFFVYTAPFISTSFTCLAAITQFFITSRHKHYRQKISLRFIRCAILLTVLFWVFHGLPYPILYNIHLSSATNMPVCISINSVLNQYTTWMTYNILIFIVPVMILVIFGYLTYRNITSLNFAVSNEQPTTGKRIQRQLTVVSDTHR